jgi:hypothetical protein
LAGEKGESSLMIAERFLRSSNRNPEIDEFEMAEMAAYNSAFHSARALLFAKDYIDRFDKIRLSRHIQRSGDFSTSRKLIHPAIGHVYP